MAVQATASPRRVGLFFGSFNPFHNGHLAIVGYMLGWMPLDELWLVVSPLNPFKVAHQPAPATERIAQLERLLAALHEPRLKLCTIELTLPRPSYTIHTLDALAARYPDYSFSVILGADCLVDLPRWQGGTRILREYQLLVYPRAMPTPLSDALAQHPHVQIVPAPLFDISSTFIREGWAQGRNMDFFIPPSIARE